MHEKSADMKMASGQLKLNCSGIDMKMASGQLKHNCSGIRTTIVHAIPTNKSTEFRSVIIMRMISTRAC